jgi:hypothetical protein
MTYKDYQIGSIVKWYNVNLLVKAVKFPICAKCYFSAHQCHKEHRKEISCINHGFACTPTTRKDKKHVVFVRVNS